LIKPDTDDSIIMVQVLKDKPAIEFYRKMGFTEPPLCFDSWKDKDFELLGCSIE